MKKDDFVLIGKVIGTFGIKGELKVYSESDFVEYRFRNGAKVFFTNHHEEKEFTITSFRIHKNTILIKIDKIDDINMVEKYVGCEIYAPLSDQPPLDDDEYYIDDLVGLDVYDENDALIGKLNDFIEVPQGYIMEITNDKKKLLIPFVDEYIIDILEDRIKVKVIEDAGKI